MKLADGKLQFGEWLPDLPDLENPGLTEAKGVIRVGKTYQPYLPLSTSGSALGATVLAALEVDGYVYVGIDGGLWLMANASPGSYSDKSGAAYSTGYNWVFTEYKSTVIATTSLSLPQAHTIGGAGNFADLSATAPKATVVGRIGQFVMLGALSLVAPYTVQWSAVDDPTNWPTPGSATALSVQSGRQYLPPEMGYVEGISSGDQWGLILMDGGIVRATYIGGSAVFQFDEIYRGPGPVGPHAWIKVGGLVYFLSIVGFFMTDGVTVTPIGKGKIDQYIFANWNRSLAPSAHAGFDAETRTIYWSFVRVSGSAPAEVLAFDIDEGFWTHASDTVQVYVGAGELAYLSHGLRAFGTDKKIGDLSATPGTAIITTAEAELNPGGRTFVQGFKPLISGSSSVTKTVALGTRDTQDGAVSYTSEATPNTRTNFADFRSDARFHRVRTTISGSFTQAIGGEFQQVPSGVV